MIVADTNLIVYLYITGDQSDKAMRVVEKDPFWVAPPLWQSEFRNVLAGYIRKGMSLEEAKRIMGLALDAMETRQVPPSPNLVLALIANSNCTAYDCEFIALAKETESCLVTADRHLLKEFPGTAISLEDFIA
jgi:predicted nucleic acid-binding protein